MTVNITFKAEHGELKLEQCKKSPLVDTIENALKDFDDLLIGKPKKIVIDIIKQ